MAGSPWWRGRPASRAARFVRGMKETRAEPRSMQGRVRRRGGRAQAGDGDRSELERGPGATGRSGEPGRSGIAVAVDLQEHAVAGRGVGGGRATRPVIGWCGSCCTISDTACRQSQDEGGRPASGSRCAVPAYQRPGGCGSSGARQPAISVDTKKKELVGDFKNAGREWRPRGNPEPVRVHDFIDPTKGKAIPYGVYDLA